MAVSGKVIEDIARKVLKKSPFVKDSSIKLSIRAQTVILQLKVGLWANDSLPGIIQEIQDEIRLRLQKVLGTENQIEINCDVYKVYHPDEMKTESEMIGLQKT